MSVRRIATLVRLDLLHALRRPILWFWIAIIVFMTWGLSSGDVRITTGESEIGGTEAWLTSEFAIGQQLSLLVLLIYVFFVAVVAGMTMLRDHELRVGDLLHSTPLRPGEYVWGRFLGVLAMCFGVLAVHLLCMIVIYHVLPLPEMDDMRGPLRVASYVRPALVFGVPTIVFLAGASLAIGGLTRRPVVVFVLPLAVILACSTFLWSWDPPWLAPSVDRLLMALDPSGYRWLEGTWLSVDRGVDFYNNAAMGFDAVFVGSRLGLIAIGLASVGLLQWRYARVLRGAKHGAPAAADPGATTAADRLADAVPGTVEPLRSLQMHTSSPGFVRGALGVARFELRELRHHPGLYLFVPLILIQVIGTMFFAVGAFGTPLLQTPGTLAVGTMNTLTLLVCLLIQFYTVESVQRDRATGAASIVYATPVPSGALLLGKAVANVAVGGVILLAALLACVVVLLIQRTVGFSLLPFALVWGLVLVPTYLVWSAFVMGVTVLVRNRYTAHAVCLGVLIYTGYKQLVGEMTWVGNWDAWDVVAWSDMGPLELNRLALTLNRLLVIAIAVFLVALTGRIFMRRDPDTARVLHRLRPVALLGHGLRLLPLIIPPLLLGIALHMQVVNGPQGQRAEERAKDYWRRNVATWTDVPLPAIADADVHLVLDPPARRLESRGTFRITNPHDEPMAAIPITAGAHWRDLAWTLDGEPYEPDDRALLCVFTPPAPLATGEGVDIGWSFHGRFPDGVTANGGGAREFILESGVVLTSFGTSFAPVVGYVDGIGVDDENEYDAREYGDDFHEGRTDPLFGSGWSYPVRMTISGPADYTYNSVGVLVSDEVDGGRRTVTWQSDYPVSFFNVIAGRWAVARGEGTAIYHHPGHAYNVDELLQAVDDARRWYSEWFHPFPWRELKLSEFPALASYAQGFATNITFSEGIGFLTKDDPETSFAYAIAAHEAAHQWWGNLLAPGKGPGGNVLSEGMAHFSTILLLEQGKGAAERIGFCRRIEETYGEDRVVDSEKPLVKTDGSRPGDTTVMYDKGGWVFWMLLNLMDRDAALAGIRAFIDHYANDPDHPVLQDLTATMRPFASDAAAFDDFVDQWFHDVVVPEYRLSGRRVDEGDGLWVVTVTVENAGTGRMPVEIAAAAGERFGEDGRPDPAYRDARVEVVLGAGERREVSIACDFEPDRALVDPDAKVLQLKRDEAITRF